MRVLPIVTRGPFDNVYDLLYLRGVDAAIVYGDVLDDFKAKPEFAAAWKRINYLLNLFPSEVHLFVRPEINSLQDLAGKTVNFNTQGTAAAYSGPIVFKQLGIDIKPDVHSARHRHGEDEDQRRGRRHLLGSPPSRSPPSSRASSPRASSSCPSSTTTSSNTTPRPTSSMRTIRR